MKALIIHPNSTEEPAHSLSVQTAFEDGGGVESDLYEILTFNQSVVDYAKDNNYDAIIYSYESVANYLSLANSNPDIMIFMPTHLSFAEQKQQLVVTDCTQDLQGGEYEFIDSTQTVDSYSNGYICGQLFDIASQRNCSLQEARVVAGLTSTNKIIDVNSAVAYSGETKLTVGSITAERTSGTSVNLALERVTDATGYKIYRNGVLIADQTELTYTDTLTEYGKFRYTYKGYNDNLSSYLSGEAIIKYHKINYIVVR